MRGSAGGHNAEWHNGKYPITSTLLKAEDTQNTMLSNVMITVGIKPEPVSDTQNAYYVFFFFSCRVV